MPIVGRRLSDLVACFLLMPAMAPVPDLGAQAVDLRFVAIDMYGGPVLPSHSEPGVAFGARLGFADLFDRALHFGVEMSSWTAEREGSELEVRDFVTGLAFWHEMGSGGRVRPFLGLGTALHVLDVSGSGGGDVPEEAASRARELDGYRPGVSGFSGFTLRLTRTGAIWLIGEYRFSVIADVPYHDLRAGARLLGPEP